jgi:hypothetical protein
MKYSRGRSIGYLGIIVLFLIIINGFKSIAAESLLISLSAQRTTDGGIIFVGQVKLPKGTKMMIDLSLNNDLLGQDTVLIKDAGNFKSGVFRKGKEPHSPGTYQIHVLSHFTKVWQSSEILKIVGENGALLPSDLLVPDDPEFPNDTRHFEVTRNVVFPRIALVSNNDLDSSTEQKAIQSVQEAYLSISERGRSADPVKGVVALIEKGGGFQPLSWIANQSSPGVWIVTLNCIDAGQKKKALWEYNKVTNKVKYLNPLAKILSWTPAE